MDGGTTLGTVAVTSVSTGIGTATFATASLSAGSHTITANYSGESFCQFSGGPRGCLASSGQTSQGVNGVASPIAADSIKLRAMQVSATPMIAQTSSQAITGAIDSAIDVGFTRNPAPLAANRSGFTYYFDADPDMQHSASEQDSVNRFLASPDGGTRRVDNDFSALGYAGLPTKAPPLAATPPTLASDWLAWVDVRGSQFDRTASGSDLTGNQIDTIAGLTRRLSSDLLVGVLGGYEHFDYSSQALAGTLTGDGWTTGAYLGWRFAPNLRFDLAGTWSDILANDTASTAAGNFTGNRWLAASGITGTYPLAVVSCSNPLRASMRCGSMRTPSPTASARRSPTAIFLAVAPAWAAKSAFHSRGRARSIWRPMPASTATTFSPTPTPTQPG